MILQQSNLFETPHPSEQVSGLTYIPDYITPAEEAELLSVIDQQPWLTDLKRRVQHYGWKYDYKARELDESQHLGNLPDWLATYADQLYKQGHFATPPDQVIINEYMPGQGISPHIDVPKNFGDTIASLSLGSSCIMEFSKDNIKIPMLLEPRSLITLTGDARYLWQHSIPARKSDRVDGQIIERSRRVSLTFRKTK